MLNSAAHPVLASGTFHMTPADLTAGYRYQLLWLLKRPRSFLSLLACFSLASEFAAALFVLNDPTWTAWDLSGPALFGLGSGALLLLLGYAIVPRIARRHFRQQKSLRQEWRFEFTQFGLHATTPGQDGTVAWT